MVNGLNVRIAGEGFHCINSEDTSHRMSKSQRLPESMFCTITIEDLIPRQDRINAALEAFESHDCITFWISSIGHKEQKQRRPSSADALSDPIVLLSLPCGGLRFARVG